MIKTYPQAFHWSYTLQQLPMDETVMLKNLSSISHLLPINSLNFTTVKIAGSLLNSLRWFLMHLSNLSTKSKLTTSFELVFISQKIYLQYLTQYHCCDIVFFSSDCQHSISIPQLTSLKWNWIHQTNCLWQTLLNWKEFLGKSRLSLLMLVIFTGLFHA